MLPRPDQLEAGSGFVVTTGIECSAPVVAGGVRQDELRLTGHWDRYAEDFAIIARMGMRYVRYGIPFHVVAAEPDRFDWAWTDRALDALFSAGLEPIADLLHFGLPDDLWGINDPALPARYLRFVEAFVARYPHVRCYTPVNEPWITAAFSTEAGFWNERARSPRLLANAITTIGELIVEASAIIRATRPDAVFLQSDACERWVAGTPDARVVEEVALRNERRFLGFQFAYGMEPLPRAREWLLRNGITEQRLATLQARGSREGAIVGHDYYGADGTWRRGNEQVVLTPTTSRARVPRDGYAGLAREYHAQLGMPFFLAETNRVTTRATAWLRACWEDLVTLRDEGLPVRGMCWYSLTDQVDWDTCLAEANGRLNTLGLVDLDRRPRPVASLYARLARAAAEGRVERVDGAPSMQRRMAA